MREDIVFCLTLGCCPFWSWSNSACRSTGKACGLEQNSLIRRQGIS